MIGTTLLLNRRWAFTQIGGGQGTGNEEWLEAFAFPTSVHVELLHLNKIPDPVSIEAVVQ
jgi:beta-mannosidase